MTAEDFISELFYRIDEAMTDIPKHPLANLWSSEIVTVGILFALKGVGNRAFYRWLARDWRKLFSALPERTRFFALYDNEGLMAVTVYRKGARALKDRLEAQDRTIAALQARFNEMALSSVASLPFDTLPAPDQINSPTVREEIESFSLSK